MKHDGHIHPARSFAAVVRRWALAAAAAQLVVAGASAQVAAPAAAREARLHLGRARAADSAGRPAVARREYEAALASDPTAVEASIGLATLLIEANDAAEAREVIARAVQRSPDDPRLRTLRIRRRSAAAADRSASGAVTNDRKQRAARPDDEETALALARVLATRGDQAGAAALFDTLLVAPAASERVAVAAVRQAIASGDRVRAATLLRAARPRYPGSGELATLADSVARATAPR